ncbi:hypothetical protein RZS08_55720, partial [Arthrospira platensis SPKY1]|nr:hypothetical protein [Arthrospira platensis SPKY1]
EGVSMIHAHDFDSGSFDNCGPVWFKVLRVNDNLVYDGGCKELNINKGGEIPANTSWFDDEVFFCCDDIGKEVMVTLRVFDRDPGPGPVAPARMAPGGDLYGRYNDCWNLTLV